MGQNDTAGSRTYPIDLVDRFFRYVIRLATRALLDGLYIPQGTWLAPCLYRMVSGVRELAKKVCDQVSQLDPEPRLML